MCSSDLQSDTLPDRPPETPDTLEKIGSANRASSPSNVDARRLQFAINTPGSPFRLIPFSLRAPLPIASWCVPSREAALRRHVTIGFSGRESYIAYCYSVIAISNILVKRNRTREARAEADIPLTLLFSISYNEADLLF